MNGWAILFRPLGLGGSPGDARMVMHLVDRHSDAIVKCIDRMRLRREVSAFDAVHRQIRVGQVVAA